MPKNIPYGRQEITDADIAAVVSVLKSDFLTQGPSIESFEKAFAKYVGAPYAVALANGTAALHLAALALDIKEGDHIISTPITFVASVNAFRYCGAQVELVDIDPETALIDLNLLEQKLKAAPKGHYKAIIPVDFAGLPVDTEKVFELAKTYGCAVVEDACHAPGASYIDSKGKRVRSGDGKYADCTVFSFHPVKHIACGEGGMITTANPAIYQKLCLLRTHGITKNPEQMLQNDGGWYYEMQQLGYNYRLTDMQAALGMSQLSRAEEGLEKRRAIAMAYDEAFEGSTVKRLVHDELFEHAYHLYVIRLNNRDAVYQHLRERGIFAQIHYVPVHLMPYYKNLGFKKGDFPMAESYYEQCLSLPMFPSLSEEDQAYVINEVLDIAQ